MSKSKCRESLKRPKALFYIKDCAVSDGCPDSFPKMMLVIFKIVAIILGNHCDDLPISLL
ncbi:MAG: hypothetical protein LBR10_13670 [Prevotellaceae bacterium]|nr:hypothetical protein [Prevotellaceae bacterium]